MSELYLITGGAGFIGSNIARRLVNQKKKVIVFDNLSTGKLKNIEDIKKNIDFIQGDITDLKLLKKVFKSVAFVLHQAALRSVPFSVDHPISANEVNVDGTLNVLIAAKETGVRRVVYASSSSVYGERASALRKENMPTSPVSPYAVSKLAAEYYCRIFPQLYGLETVSLRYFNVYGPYQDPNSQYSAVIPLFIKAILNDESPEVHGDGEQSRDFTYIDNVVDANILACEAKKANGVYMNIATGQRISVNALVDSINKILGKRIKSKHGPVRAGDVKHTRADITLAKQILGYQPRVSFEEGMTKTVKWFSENLSY